MKEHFCILNNKEQKAYRYTKMYYDFLLNETNIKKYSTIGTRIQGEEIKRDLEIKNIKEGTQRAIDEGNKWIDEDENGMRFRVYLNTIKFIADAFYITNKELNHENFICALKRTNEKKEYNESIF
jgi:hypothetical protein